jgi:hypothetical protein
LRQNLDPLAVRLRADAAGEQVGHQARHNTYQPCP